MLVLDNYLSSSDTSWYVNLPVCATPSHPPQLLDKANEATDRKLARHLVSLYGNGVGRLGNEVRGRGSGQCEAQPRRLPCPSALPC